MVASTCDVRSGTAPGGEPLLRASCRPRSLRLIVSLAKTCGNRRLPRATQRFAVLWVGCKRLQKHRDNASRWVIRGSRPLRHFFARWSAVTNIARSPGWAPKRLPSRGCVDRSSRRPAKRRGRGRIPQAPFTLGSVPEPVLPPPKKEWAAVVPPASSAGCKEPGRESRRGI